MAGMEPLIMIWPKNSKARFYPKPYRDLAQKKAAETGAIDEKVALPSLQSID
jgi:hypothetical protein